MNTKCQNCGQRLNGRADKKFCSDQCRATYHHKSKKETDKAIFYINHVLKNNRDILKQLNPNGKITVPKNYLVLQGFDFRFYTHVYKTNNNTYFFCYEFGYMPLLKEEKVVIINWQEYMKKNIPDSFNILSSQLA